MTLARAKLVDDPQHILKLPYAIFSCRADIAVHAGSPVTIPVSAFIIVKNEERHLSRTISALKPWVDEIIVVDSGSTDGTMELARSLGAKASYHEWQGYGSQKGFAERLCRNGWVLNVDADEVVTPALAAEMQELFAEGRTPEPGAYRLRILTVYPGDARPRAWARDYNEVRLYHRSIGAYREHPAHDRVILRNTVPKQLRQPIFHHSFLSFSHIIEKNNRYSSFRAQDSKTRSSSYLKFRLAIEFPLNFLKCYLGRRHILGGWKGFYFALCHAFMRTTRIAKMLELAWGQEKPEGAEIFVTLPPMGGANATIRTKATSPSLIKLMQNEKPGH
jgi:glycosyltransferase involved in cell wall biosynthesis